MHLLLALFVVQLIPAGTVRVTVPATIDATTCSLRYTTGVGVFTFAQPKPDISGFDVALTLEGRAAKRLHGYVSCVGYQLELLEFESIPEIDRAILKLQPKPLGATLFAGVIRGLPASAETHEVTVRFWPNWHCRFFNLIDCVVAPQTIGRTGIAPDGRFSIGLPDFSRDPVIGSFAEKGSFSFSLQDDGGNALFVLAPAQATAPQGRVRVAASYPSEQVFDVKPGRTRLPDNPCDIVSLEQVAEATGLMVTAFNRVAGILETTTADRESRPPPPGRLCVFDTRSDFGQLMLYVPAEHTNLVFRAQRAKYFATYPGSARVVSGVGEEAWLAGGASLHVLAAPDFYFVVSVQMYQPEAEDVLVRLARAIINRR